MFTVCSGVIHEFHAKGHVNHYILKCQLYKLADIKFQGLLGRVIVNFTGRPPPERIARLQTSGVINVYFTMASLRVTFVVALLLTLTSGATANDPLPFELTGLWRNIASNCVAFMELNTFNTYWCNQSIIEPSDACVQSITFWALLDASDAATDIGVGLLQWNATQMTGVATVGISPPNIFQIAYNSKTAQMQIQTSGSGYICSATLVKYTLHWL